MGKKKSKRDSSDPINIDAIFMDAWATESFDHIAPHDQAGVKEAEVIAFQAGAESQAMGFVGLFWHSKNHETLSARLQAIQSYLDQHPINDRWQVIHLIEAASTFAMGWNRSKEKARIAQSKNAAPREWVRQEWKTSEQKAKSKASFARQHSNLVRKKFRVDVKPDTIVKSWLKGL